MKKLFKTLVFLLSLTLVLPTPVANSGVPEYPALDQFKLEITPYDIVWDTVDCLPGEPVEDCGYPTPALGTPLEVSHDDTLSVDLTKNLQVSLVAPDTTHPECLLRYNIEDLYFVPTQSPESRISLEFDQWADGRVLQGAGVYEADIIAYCAPDLVQAPDSILDRIQDALLPKALAHWFLYDQVGTVRFNVVEANNQPECCSSIVFIPGIKGSVLERTNLFGQRDVLWPPSLNPTNFSDDMAELALDSDGKSLNDVRVGGLMETFYGVSIYDGFADFADGLVADGTIGEWQTFPYDWRLAVADTIEEGVKNVDGTVTNWVTEIERLAGQSKSGKVALVTHSMGGLMGKALIKKLEAVGKADLVESFTMVGTPQTGTPQAIASMLHGDDEGIPGGFVATIGLDFIVPASGARSLSLNMPSAYNLLPSSAYFADVSEPVALFSDASFTTDWRGCWGDSLDNYTELSQFLTAECASRSVPNPNQLRLPAILNSSLLNQSINEHTELDGYQFPESIRVIQVAGWGLPTARSVEYRTRHLFQNYDVRFSVEGDKTVLYPSAVSSTAETVYFDLQKYNLSTNTVFQHRNILNANPVQDLLVQILQDTGLNSSIFIDSNKPVPEDATERLKLSTHSPVILGAYDQYENFTGINPSQDLTSAIPVISEEIPGSTFVVFGDSQHIFLPEGGKYRFVYRGIGNGSTTVEIGVMKGNAVTPVASFTDIPTSPSSIATIEVENLEEPVVVALDNNGDGVVDQEVLSDDAQAMPVISLDELLSNLKINIGTLNVSEKLKRKLLKRVENLEKKLDKKRRHNQLRIDHLESRLDSLVKRGKLVEGDMAEVKTLLTELENNDILLVDTEMVGSLLGAIDAMPVKASLKKTLQKRVKVLLKKQGLIRTLDSFIKVINQRGRKGKLIGDDVEEIINLIQQIKNVI